MDIGLITGFVGVASDPRRTWGRRRDTCKYTRDHAAPYNAHSLQAVEDVYISGYKTTSQQPVNNQL